MDQLRKVLKGEPVSTGIAIAQAYIYEPLEPNTCKVAFAKGMEREYVKQFQNTVSKAKEELKQLYDKLSPEDEENAQIFMAHQVVLEDECMLQEIRQAIEKDRMYPDTAIEIVFGKYINMLSDLSDEMIAERSKDLRDIEKRLIRIWQGKKEYNLATLAEDVIVVAHDLLPSDLAALNCSCVKGIITEVGGEISHCAILARCYGIPAILGVKDAVRKIPEGVVVGLDALSGEVIVRPEEEDITHLDKKLQHLLERFEDEKQYLDKPVATKDGVDIQVGINIGSENMGVEDSWYDYVGLLRSEFLYMEKSTLPTEEEQFYAYKNIVEEAKGKLVILRTLDIGADKLLPYMDLPKEDNPFLGRRALRFSLEHADMFLVQIRAALRASAYGDLQIIFPMVNSMDDIYHAKSYVKKAMEELDAEGIAYNRDIKLGAMIETPSIGIIADMVADEVDFASIGTNDLVQYCCAADRSNIHMTEYYQSYAPAILRFISNIIEAFQKKGKRIGICGEMAGTPKGALLMAGLGARWISMDVSTLASVKAAFSEVTMSELKRNAEVCKNLRTEQEVRAFLGM